jgi:hypothetical protein
VGSKFGETVACSGQYEGGIAYTLLRHNTTFRDTKVTPGSIGYMDVFRSSIDCCSLRSGQFTAAYVNGAYTSIYRQAFSLLTVMRENTELCSPTLPNLSVIIINKASKEDSNITWN